MCGVQEVVVCFNFYYLLPRAVLMRLEYPMASMFEVDRASSIV